MGFFGIEGLLVSLVLLVTPFVILYVLFKVFPPWDDARSVADSAPPSGLEPPTAPGDAGAPQTTT